MSGKSDFAYLLPLALPLRLFVVHLLRRTGSRWMNRKPVPTKIHARDYPKQPTFKQHL